MNIHRRVRGNEKCIYKYFVYRKFCNLRHIGDCNSLYIFMRFEWLLHTQPRWDYDDQFIPRIIQMTLRSVQKYISQLMDKTPGVSRSSRMKIIQPKIDYSLQRDSKRFQENQRKHRSNNDIRRLMLNVIKVVVKFFYYFH